MRRVADVSGYEFLAAAAQAFTFAWIAVEVTWGAFTVREPDRRRAFLRRARTAAAMGAGALVVGLAYTAVLHGLWVALAPGAPDALVGVWQSHPIVGAAVAFVAWDAVGFAYHWIGHHTAVGWAAHRPHHTGATFDITLAMRQTWFPVHGLACQPVLALAGFDFRVIAVCAAASNLWQALEHSTAMPAFPRWFAAVCMTPASHRHHHGRDARPVNLGPIFTVWDRMAGSWLPAYAPAPTAYGDSSTAGAVATELAAWRALLQRADEVDHVVGVEGVALELAAVTGVE